MKYLMPRPWRAIAYPKISNQQTAALVRAAYIVAFASAVTMVAARAADIDEIEVLASRTDQRLIDLPFSIDVIDSREIQSAQPMLGLDESLLGVAGLQMQNRYNYSQDLRISMRGFGARAAFGIRGIRIVVDGIPETLPDGQGGVDGIDLGAARRIEILKGGASAIYGNAGGGVILVESERGEDINGVIARIAAGADGYQHLQLKGGEKIDRFDYLISANSTRLDGYREQSAARNHQLSVRLGFAPVDGGDWSLSLHHTDQPLAEDAGGITREQAGRSPRSARDRNVEQNAGEVLSQTRLGLRYRRSFSASGEWSARTYVTRRDFDALLPFVSGAAIDLDRRFYGGGLQLKQGFNAFGRDHQWHVGLDLDRQRDDRVRFDNNNGMRGDVTLQQSERVDSDGVFAQVLINPLDTLSITVGLRYDALDFRVGDVFLPDGDDSGRVAFDAWSPVLAANWKVSDRLRVFANASRSFESPTTTELSNPVGGGFNQSLEPAMASHREVGLRARGSDDSQLALSLFDITLSDELLPFELPTAPGRDFFENAGSSDRRGIEFSWIKQWRPGWRSRFTHTWSDFRFDEFVRRDGSDFSGNRTPGSARHVSFAELRYDNPAQWFVVAEAIRYSGIPLDNANTTESDQYLLTNLRAGAVFRRGRSQWQPFLSMTNLLNDSYAANTRINAFGGRYFEPGPDRGVYLGVTVSFSGNVR
ncbi:MAG: TonB-dependent receptor family protein [Woeseiaceae bacterium]